MSATATSVEEPVEAGRSTNLLARLLRREELLSLTAEQVGPYLEANRRSVESLLAAGRATGDKMSHEKRSKKILHPISPQPLRGNGVFALFGIYAPGIILAA